MPNRDNAPLLDNTAWSGAVRVAGLDRAPRERWGASELCWRSNPEMHAAGEALAARWEAGAA